jgi:hypothetical protein
MKIEIIRQPTANSQQPSRSRVPEPRTQRSNPLVRRPPITGTTSLNLTSSHLRRTSSPLPSLICDLCNLSCNIHPSPSPSPSPSPTATTASPIPPRPCPSANHIPRLSVRRQPKPQRPRPAHPPPTHSARRHLGSDERPVCGLPVRVAIPKSASECVWLLFRRCCVFTKAIRIRPRWSWSWSWSWSWL